MGFTPHPPFNNYIRSIEEFIEIYKLFEERIKTIFSDTKILIENRSGTPYRKGKFLISMDTDIIELSRLIEKENLLLSIVLDIPQLLTAQSINKNSKDKLIKTIENLKKCVANIEGINIWGKKVGRNGRIHNSFTCWRFKFFF